MFGVETGREEVPVRSGIGGMNGLSRLGFDVMRPTREGSFVSIRAVKSTTAPAPELTLPFPRARRLGRGR
jgi:hypothetical protein